MNRSLLASCFLLLLAGCSTSDYESTTIDLELRPEQLAPGADENHPESGPRRSGFLYRAEGDSSSQGLVVAHGHSGYGQGPKAGTSELSGEVRFEFREGRLWLAFPPGQVPYVDRKGNVRLLESGQVFRALPQGKGRESLDQVLQDRESFR